MTDFTKQELQTMADGLDALVRSEGNAIGQSGLNGLRQSTEKVAARFSAALSAYGKIVELANAPEQEPPADPPTE